MTPKKTNRKVTYKLWLDSKKDIPDYFCGKKGEGTVVVFWCTNLSCAKWLIDKGYANVISVHVYDHVLVDFVNSLELSPDVIVTIH